MARTHYWQYLVSEEGNPINIANISIYAAGSTTTVYVYLQNSGGTATNSDPQLQTDSEGFFEFWIAGSDEAFGYESGTKFRIAWSKPGIIDNGYIDYVDIFLAPEEVDEEDTDTVKNKLVSNNLAKGWESKTSTTTSVLTSGGWTPSGADYYHDITHNLSNSYPVVMLYNDADNKTDTIEVEPISTNEVRIWKTDNPDSHVTIIG